MCREGDHKSFGFVPVVSLKYLLRLTVKITLLIVAEKFGKAHKNVLRDIKELTCSEDFRLLNFEPSKYKNKQGKLMPYYRITRDGLMFLVSGLPGKTLYLVIIVRLQRCWCALG